jgi:hypothetical protein
MLYIESAEMYHLEHLLDLHLIKHLRRARRDMSRAANNSVCEIYLML